MSKEFSIHGRILVNECNNHQDMVLKLTEILRSNGFRFVGETKEVKNK